MSLRIFFYVRVRKRPTKSIKYNKKIYFNGLNFQLLLTLIMQKIYNINVRRRVMSEAAKESKVKEPLTKEEKIRRILLITLSSIVAIVIIVGL